MTEYDPYLNIWPWRVEDETDFSTFSPFTRALREDAIAAIVTERVRQRRGLFASQVDVYQQSYEAQLAAYENACGYYRQEFAANALVAAIVSKVVH